MTGDWIKLRKSLRSDPRVLALCAKLGKSKAEIIGALCLMWFIADDHGEKLPSVTRALLSAELGVSGLAENLPECWLADAPDGLIFPDYDAHNGSTAKARALARKRVERFRNARRVTQALPRGEESREIKRDAATDCAPNFRASFLAAYPSCPNKKLGLVEAERHWHTLKPDEVERALAAIKVYAECVAKWTPQQRMWVPKPLTWLQDNGPEFAIERENWERGEEKKVETW